MYIGEASCILSLFIISPQKFIEIKVFKVCVRALETKKEKQRIGPFLFFFVCRARSCSIRLNNMILLILKHFYLQQWQFHMI